MLQASMLEIYNEIIQDLLTKNGKTLELKTQGNKIHLPGLTEMFVENEDDIAHIMNLGDTNRTTASTRMNSTRYDAILMEIKFIIVVFK